MKLKVKLETEIKFCHNCGGWIMIQGHVCPVCKGSGVTVVLIPIPEAIEKGQRLVTKEPCDS